MNKNCRLNQSKCKADGDFLISFLSNSHIVISRGYLGGISQNLIYVPVSLVKWVLPLNDS